MDGLVRAAKKVLASPIALFNYYRYRNGPPRYRTLRRLVARVKPSTIVEIGVWRGDAACQLIRAAAKAKSQVRYWGFDLFDTDMPDETLLLEASLRPDSLERVRARLSRLGAQIVLVRGDSTVTVPTTPLPPLDFVFIDGGHSYETVSQDWHNIGPKLAPDGIVVFDDYTNEDAVVHEGFGVRRLVDEISPDWDVRLLDPIDRFPRDYGFLETRLAMVTRRGR